MCGTSPGSVVALTLASGKTADTPLIFTRLRPRVCVSPDRFHLFDQSTACQFQESLESHFPQTMSGRSHEHKLVVPSFKLTTSGNRIGGPVFSHISPARTISTSLVVDVALRSAAAPTIFPLTRVRGRGMMANTQHARHRPGLGHSNRVALLTSLSLVSLNRVESNIITLNPKLGIVQWMLNRSVAIRSRCRTFSSMVL